MHAHPTGIQPLLMPVLNPPPYRVARNQAVVKPVQEQSSKRRRRLSCGESLVAHRPAGDDGATERMRRGGGGEADERDADGGLGQLRLRVPPREQLQLRDRVHRLILLLPARRGVAAGRHQDMCVGRRY
jgi:hypothetical protein